MNTGSKILARFVGIVILALLPQVLGLQLLADTPAALLIHGHIRSEIYSPQSSEPVTVVETKVMAYSSNIWWRIIATPLYEGLAVDCKRIPDGIRLLPINSTNINAAINADNYKSPIMGGAADVFPFYYPPPVQMGLFSAWLTFTQQPELPILKKNQMRRFLDKTLQDNPENIGTFSASHIPDNEQFLSRLSISNNGVAFSSDGKANKLSGLFADGYEELLYEVVSLTNMLGGVLPAKAILTIRAPGPGNKIYNRFVERITLERAENWVSNNSPSANFPTMALDHRFAKPAKRFEVNYVVTNDEWLSVTNAQLKSLASFFLKGKEQDGGNSYLLVGSVCLIAAPILAIVILKRKSSNNNKSNNI